MDIYGVLRTSQNKERWCPSGGESFQVEASYYIEIFQNEIL